MYGWMQCFLQDKSNMIIERLKKHINDISSSEPSNCTSFYILSSSCDGQRNPCFSVQESVILRRFLLVFLRILHHHIMIIKVFSSLSFWYYTASDESYVATAAARRRLYEVGGLNSLVFHFPFLTEGVVSYAWMLCKTKSVWGTTSGWNNFFLRKSQCFTICTILFQSWHEN